MDLSAAFSGADDVGAIEYFYAQHPHLHVAFRAEKFSENAANGNFIMIRGGDDMIGCSGIFRHQDADGRTIVELGQSRVTIGGYNLYQFMVYIRALKVFADRPGADFFFAQFDESNPGSIKRALKIGYKHFQPSDGLIDLATQALPEDKRADALGVETVYLAFHRRDLHIVQSYIARGMNKGRFITEGKKGPSEMRIEPSAQDVIKRGLAL